MESIPEKRSWNNHLWMQRAMGLEPLRGPSSHGMNDNFDVAQQHKLWPT